MLPLLEVACNILHRNDTVPSTSSQGFSTCSSTWLAGDAVGFCAPLSMQIAGPLFTASNMHVRLPHSHAYVFAAVATGAVLTKMCVVNFRTDLGYLCVALFQVCFGCWPQAAGVTRSFYFIPTARNSLDKHLCMTRLSERQPN